MAAKPYKLLAIEREHGDLTELIPQLVNQFGQVETAQRLNVSQHTISRWLKENGYIRHTQYVHRTELDPRP